jgi:hypothetical protein
MILAVIPPVTLVLAWLADQIEESGDGLSVRPIPIEHWCPTCRGAACARYGAVVLTEGEQIDHELPFPYGSWPDWAWMEDEDKNAILEDTHRFTWGLALTRGDAHETWLYLLLEDAWPWHDEVPWRPLMPISADSWRPFDPFPDVEALPSNIKMEGIVKVMNGELPDTEHYRSVSPSGRWVYVKRVLPRGTMLSTVLLDEYNDPENGNVIFDGDIIVPSLFERPHLKTPWMSFTPMEIMSQIPAVQTCRDMSPRGKNRGLHVIIGGLGMGWLLCKIANLSNVDRITLIEESQDLCDWILPRLCPFLPEGKSIEVLIGDVFDVIRGLHADMAVIDIWPTLGDIKEDMDRLQDLAPDVWSWWGWGHR